VDPRSTLADYYRACDLCVQASREEGLGFSPLEALACGIPVVATAVGGLLETVRDGDTGWSYRPGDAGALAAAIADALDDPEEAAARAARGRALVRERYDSQIVFHQMNELLEGP
jgi:glycosyltransferase involved in cell wall biosynthesis